ncbi:MAG: Calx-beta domain-containing protein [Pirellulaceae bacterium]|nr:Calx-beta domain-containing protein [Pirellulaceae bacterium]
MSIQWFERLVGSFRGPGAKRSRKRLNDALRPTRRRHALHGFESLEERRVLAVVYVDDSFTANPGQTIADADLGKTGSQPAIFGATAFSTINAALAVVTSSGTIIVNGGTYAETVSLTGTQTIEITGSNSAQAVIIDDLTTIAGTPVVIEGSSNLTVGDADSRTLAGVISGSGSFTKQGTGIYTLTASNLYTGATNIYAGTLRTAATTSAPAGAVGIYTFDSVSGATVNNAGSAGVGKNGALVAGSAVVGGGRSGNAMSTSGGTGARMDIAGAGISLASGAWTGAAWFNNLFADGDWNTLFVDSNAGDAQVIIQNGTNRLGVYTGEFRSSGFDLVPALNSGWHHVAAVGSGTTTTFYRNGVLVGTADRKSGTNIFSVGASPAGGGMQRFAQLIDDVYIYQSALTPAQIMTLYNSGAGTAANSIPDSSSVTIASGAFLDLNGSSEAIGALAGAGTVTSGIAGSPTLTVGGGNGSGSFSGAVQNGAGTVSLAKTGTGTQTLSGSNLYTGATAVNNGTLVINGTVTSNVTVTTPGALNGSGTVMGNVLGNGTFSPGNSPGVMTIVGNFTPSGTVNFEVNSGWTTAGTHFDQYLVTGLVNMAGSTVTFTNTVDASSPAANSVVKLIDNNGTIDLTTAPTSPVNGALVTIGSRSFRLFYNRGDGNDVTLESQNTAPTAASSSITTDEDFTYTFSAMDFSFNDTDSGDVLSAVKITIIESAGDLEWFDGSSWVGVTQDQEISKADIDANRLRFVPAANANGSPYSTFGFKVQDTGGPVLSVATNTITINVSAINDLPAAQSSSVTTNEDTLKTFAVGDFLFTDLEGDSLASLTISSLSLVSGDTLKLSGTDVTVGQTITAANIPNLVYAPAADANGAARSIFGFTVNDADNGTVAGTMTINVVAVDDAPVLTINDTSTFVENAAPTVVASNLTLTDPDGPNINGATVSLTTSFNSAQDGLQFTNQNGISGIYSAATGILRLSGSASAAAYQTALRSVTYSNNSQNPTTGARSVQFSVGSSTLANPANGHFYEFVSAQGGSWTSAKAGAESRTLFGLQGYLATVTSASENAFIAGKLIGQGWMGASDVEVEGTWRWVTGPEAGQEFWQGAGGGSAVNGMYNNWTPGEPNNFGPFGEDYAHFRIDNTWNDYRVDNGATAGYVVEYGGMLGDPTLLQIIGTSTVSVVAVNDAPSGANKTLTTNEDTQLTIVAADFGFSDVAESHAFNGVKITTLPATGTLRLNGASILAGDFATKAQLDANQLTFDAVTNASGSPYTGFAFQVEDDGGTANGGVNLDLTPKTITINLLAINDLPVAQASSVTTNEDTSKTFAMGDYLFTDVEGDSLASITISSLSLASGDTLKLSGTDVTVGQTIIVADIPNLVFTPYANANGAARSIFGFTASDAGNGTVAATMTINVTAVADVAISDASVSEGGNLQFNVSLDSPLDFDAVITYSTANGLATTTDNDYTGQIGQTVTIPAGSTTAQITVQTTADNKVELGESLFVSLNSIVVGNISLDLADVVGGGNGTGTGGSGGINPVTGAVVSSGLYGAISGSNVKNVYRLVPSSSFIDGVFIPDGGPTRGTAVPVSSTGLTATGVGDSVDQSWDHIINGTPNLPHYYPISFPTTTEIRFATNKGLTFDLDAIEVANPGQRVTAFTALAAVANTNSNGAEFTIVVDGIILAQTYVQGGQSAPMSVAIGPDNRFLTLITTDGADYYYDDNLWGDSTLVLSSLSQSVVLSNAHALGTILNDDSSTISISDTSVTEGGNLEFNVMLSSPVDVDTVITFSTADGSATTADSDYTGQTLQTLTIPAGQTSRLITIVATADNKVELDETMTVQLTSANASGRTVTIDDGSGRGTLVNNDTATVSINNPLVTETNSGTTVLAFTVSLDKPVDVAVSAIINTVNGTTNPATIADSDYVALTNGTVTFIAGSTTSQSVNVTINGDSKLELNEQLQLVLSALNASGRSVQLTGAAATLTAIGTITNDDTPRVGSILQPTSVTTTMGAFSAAWATTKMIDKSGLSVGYTSNVTNFDTYIAGNPTHSYNAHQITPADAQAWASSNGVLTGTITFNLGSMYVVESMALWNRIDAGIGGFNLLADADGDFNSGAVTVLSNRTALLGRSGAQVFGFTPTTAQYLRLQVLSDAHSFPFVIINEIAFEGGQITVDATPPTSQISALAPNSSSLVIPITVTGSDGGPLVSGVKEYDLYYSTGGGFVKFATVPTSSPSTTFTGAANTTYWFRSLGRDNAGNEETKTTSDTSTRIGDVAPPASQVTTAVPTSGGLFTISMTGSKATGSALAAFDVYVSIDDGAAVLIRSANAVSLGGGNYSGKIPFQGILDGTSHTYRFYSRGRDDAGNVEATPVVADLSVTNSFAAAGLKATAIDVQKGANQRSYVRNLDILFSSATGLSELLAAGRVKVERFGIDATSVSPGTGSLVTGFALTQDDKSLRLDFGANGLGGLREAGNGFYRILIDQDGNNSFGDPADTAFEFFRLWGDANGDGKVDSTDLSLVTSQVGRVGNNVDGDLDGNGVVNSLDRLFATQQNGKKLRDSLFGWLDD